MARLLTTLLLVLTGLTTQAAWAQNIRLESIQLHKAEEGLQLSASMGFELPTAVEEALLKGIPIVFVAQIDVSKDRWYWYDKHIASQTRSLRLSYQPLTRRWRVQAAGPAMQNESGLSQHYDSLGAVLAAIRRVTRLKIADWSDIDTDAKYSIEFRFRLDVSQLPRPFQIGAATSGDWNLSASRTLRFVHDGKTEAAK